MKFSLMAGGAALGAKKAFGDTFVSCTAIPPQPYDIDIQTGLSPIENFPTSPFIMNPFSDALPIPSAMRPGYRQTDGSLLAPSSSDWAVRECGGVRQNTISRPGPGTSCQDSIGARPRSLAGTRVPDAGTHQLWSDGSGVAGCPVGFPSSNTNPILYHIRLQVRQHSYTSSNVLPIDKDGNLVVPPTGVAGPQKLPASTIYGFNGTFPGPRINAMYGQPALVRFENDLDYNPLRLDRQDFGAPDWAFLTHLHNGHTAPESDGQPHHLTENRGGYQPGQWVDNLYLNYPAGCNDAEKQSFFWFHDHRMHHTGANVYKGMVGLFPIYDPKLDPGDETKGLGLPGRKTVNKDGTFDVKYDIPMALYDCALDDGITQHQDYHNGCGEVHPEWWGKSYFRHFPNHGFVGDIFTINGTAFPVLNVYRRKYRLRFLDASVSRIYELMLMRGTPKAAPGTQGQWQIPDGQQCMRFTQIAAEGGLLPNAIVRDSFQIWPAKRREFIVDFTKYQDGSPTKAGDVIYMVNVLQMDTGRLPTFNKPGDTLTYKVPMMKIVIGGRPPEPDASANIQAGTPLRPMPAIPANRTQPPAYDRSFTLQRGSGGGETEWLINGLQFDPLNALAVVKRGAGEVWNVNNGGGGWVHPMHLHMEEHTILMRQNSTNPHPDDTGKEDVIALDPSESTWLFRRFRTFVGCYVAHCHNLAHEDHNMMFGWGIVP